jgi:hypothetical protein
MMKSIRFALAAALLAGCAGQNVRFSEDNRKLLTTQQVHAVHLQPLGFVVESTGRTVAAVFFTPLVAIAYAAEGGELHSTLGLEDPAPRVKERLLGALEKEYRIPNLTRVAQPAARFGAEPIYAELGGVIVEVRTTHWGIDNNRAKYAAGVRVLRLPDGETIWDATCDQVIAGKDKPSPTLDELRADSGALLKASLRDAADICADQLSEWALERAEKR